MAPADHRGYALLPQDDLSAAGGGPVRPPEPEEVELDDAALSKRRSKRSSRRSADGSFEADSDDDEDNDRYDGGVRFDQSKEPWVIHPYHPLVMRWYYGLIFLLVADVVYLPLETAFGRFMPQRLIFCIDALCTLIFCADIVLQFFLQIPSPTGDFWVFNHQIIIESYLRGNFCVDLISVLPFSELHVILDRLPGFTGTRTSYALHVLRFTKLLRMLRLRRILRRHVYDVNLTYTQRSVIFSGCTVLVSIHVFSCVWATLGNYQGGHSWLAELYATKEMRLKGSGYTTEDTEPMRSEDTLAVYIISTYFALYTLTGIGYGDIGPSSVSEYVFVILIMLAGSIIWATIIGEIVSVLRHSSADDVKYNRMTDEVVFMGKEFNLDPDLQYRVQAYLHQSRMIFHSNFIREKVLSCMTSDLAVKVSQVLHHRWFNQIWWLKNVNQNQFMVQLTLAFDPMLYAPKEVIRSTDRLFVIQRGLCIHGAQLLGKDSCFGVDMLLTQDALKINVITIAFSYLHVLFLTREALQATLERFPREQELVKRSYRALCVMRGWDASGASGSCELPLPDQGSKTR
eukprot:TRINITY_DN22473_c0_g3_i2.p1 TRINITY_DN22473_c0_g3~~TRINITY_DN22473_c0_g3_i2.p1  ORF type:complete len:571 (+),score=130.09 TRINITY_DN22473_c0_g3_i2:134-1846(+)